MFTLKKYLIHPLEFPLTPPELKPYEVHVWQLPIDLVQEENLPLSEHEVKRSQAFHFEKDRIQYRVSTAYLRKLISLYTGQDPEKITYARGLKGKPHLIDPAQLKFNMTHSHHMALYAFTLDREIGVDVEFMRPMQAMEGIVENQFSKAEQALFNNLSEKDKSSYFFATWTLKEAYLKAHGTGIREGIHQIEFQKHGEKEGDSFGVIIEIEHCECVQYFIDATYSAAIAVVT